MNNLSVPVWGWALMGAGLIAFLALIIVYACRHGLSRPLFASPYVLWISIFTILPVVLIAYYAFTDGAGNLTLNNFRAFLDSSFLMREKMRPVLGDEMALQQIPRTLDHINTLTFSLWMAFLCTAFSLLLGYPAALFMADRNFKLGSTIVVLFIIPMWMNFLLRTIAWMSLLEDTGLINSFLIWIGVGPKQLINTQGAVLLGMVYNYLPFMVFPIYTSLSKLDHSLTEAAADLGCNSWRTLYKVIMPLSIPGVISGITMVFMPSVTTFVISSKLGGGKTPMFGDLIESTFLSAKNWNLGSALSLIMMVLILISLSILRKADPNGEGGGAL